VVIYICQCYRLRQWAAGGWVSVSWQQEWTCTVQLRSTPCNIGNRIYPKLVASRFGVRQTTLWCNFCLVISWCFGLLSSLTRTMLSSLETKGSSKKLCHYGVSHHKPKSHMNVFPSQRQTPFPWCGRYTTSKRLFGYTSVFSLTSLALLSVWQCGQ